MAEANDETDVECTICLETLRKPIRMLSCGHNFCHECIESIYRPGEQNSCPSCRKVIEENINKIPRNFALENLIENMDKVIASASKTSVTPTIYLSGDGLKQVRDAAKAYMEAKEFKKALQTLHVLTSQEKGLNKLLALMKIIKCQGELGEDVSETCAEVSTAMKEDLDFHDASLETVDELDETLRVLVNTFTELSLKTTLVLQRCRFNLIKRFFDKETRLTKLSSIGHAMKNSAHKLKQKQETSSIEAESYSIMEMVLDEMQNVGDVEANVKCVKVAWFINYYGYCCNELGDFDKSISLHEKAIFLMKTVYGAEAVFFKVFPFLHCNLAFAYEKLNKLDEASNCFEKAIIMCPQTKDFEEDEMTEVVSRLTEGFRSVHCQQSMIHRSTDTV